MEKWFARGVTLRLKDWADLIFDVIRLIMLAVLLMVVGIPLLFVSMLGVKLIYSMFF